MELAVPVRSLLGSAGSWVAKSKAADERLLGALTFGRDPMPALDSAQRATQLARARIGDAVDYLHAGRLDGHVDLLAGAELTLARKVDDRLRLLDMPEPRLVEVADWRSLLAGYDDVQARLRVVGANTPATVR